MRCFDLHFERVLSVGLQRIRHDLYEAPLTLAAASEETEGDPNALALWCAAREIGEDTWIADWIRLEGRYGSP